MRAAGEVQPPPHLSGGGQDGHASFLFGSRTIASGTIKAVALSSLVLLVGCACAGLFVAGTGGDGGDAACASVACAYPCLGQQSGGGGGGSSGDGAMETRGSSQPLNELTTPKATLAKVALVAFNPCTGGIAKVAALTHTCKAGTLASLRFHPHGSPTTPTLGCFTSHAPLGCE
jgi:hypothetical protein